MAKNKSKNDAFYYSRIYLTVSLVLAVAGAVMFNSFRCTWVFVDIALFNGFALGVLCLMIVNAVALAILLALRLYEIKRGGVPVYKSKGFKTVSKICLILTSLTVILNVVYTVVVTLLDSAQVTDYYLRDSLPIVLFFIAVPALALYLPKAGRRCRNTIICVVAAVCLVIGINQLFPLSTYKITSDPVVIDTGEDYTVMFATTDEGTGYVSYIYEGEEKTVYDEDNGKLNVEKKVHSIKVPYEELKGNTYTIGSTRVIEQYGYGSRLGKEITSGEYTLTVNESEKQEYLVVSDWHSHLKKAYQAIDYLGSYDAVLLMGDAAQGLDYEEEFIDNVVEFAGQISGGEMPVIYARGNHDTRGSYASKVPAALGEDKLYHLNTFGDITFIVLDSTEDKEDEHAEYGGMNNYAEQRKDQIEWLKTLNLDDTGTVISLSHMWQFAYFEEDVSKECWNELDRLGTELMISGHSHDCRLVGDKEDYEREFFKEFTNITCYMDGGWTNTYTASKMTIDNGEIQLEACNSEGEQVFDMTF